jgi:hypothetical protein
VSGRRTKSIQAHANNPPSNWLSIVLLGFMALLMIAMIGGPYMAERQRTIQESWPRVQGKSTDTRIVRRAPTGRNFPFIVYVGECAVEYSVAGKKYSVWVPSGYASPDPKFIFDKVQECPVSRYAVHYNPKNPGEAVAKGID